LEFTKVRLGADIYFGAKGEQRQFNGIMDCMTKIIKTNGIQGLYCGYKLSVIGMFFYRGFNFGLFDTARGYIEKDASFSKVWLIANFSSITTTSILYPWDTLITRTMMQAGLEKYEIMYNGVADTIRKIYKNEGLKGFYKGMMSSLFRSSIASIVLVIYDRFERRFITEQ